MKQTQNNLSKVILIVFFFATVQLSFGQTTSDTTKIDNLIQKNKDEEAALRGKISVLTQAKERDEIERKVAIKMYKTQLLEKLNKLKDQYIEGSDVLVNMIDKTNDLNTFVIYGNARSSFLDLVNPMNYSDFNSSLNSVKDELKDNKKAAFWTAATDLVSNLQNFVANPASIVPGIISAANKYSAKKETISNAQFELEKSISFISALYSNLEQLDRDDKDLNKVLDDYSKKLIVYFPNYFTEFSDSGDITYTNLGHPLTSQKTIKDLFKDRVINYFSSLSTKIDNFEGGIESLKQQESIILNEKKVKFVKKVNQDIITFLTEYDANRLKVIDRIIVFRELIKSYSRAKGLTYTKDTSLQQTIVVIKSFNEGAYQIQNSSRQAITEIIK